MSGSRTITVPDRVSPVVVDGVEMLLARAADARRTLAPPVSDARKNLEPKLSEARKTVEPRLSDARKTLEPKLSEARKTLEPKLSEARKTLEPKLSEARSTLEPKLSEARKTLEPAGSEALLRGGAALAALRGASVTQSRWRRWRLALACFGLGAAAGAALGMALRQWVAPAPRSWQDAPVGDESNDPATRPPSSSPESRE